MIRRNVWIFGALLVGCTASGPEATAPPGPATLPDPPVSPPAPPAAEGCGPDVVALSRLTRSQIAQTLEVALGIAVEAEVALPPDGSVGPFEAGTGLSEPFIRSLMDVAERVADGYAAQLECPPGPTCVEEILERLGPRLFRRPFTSEEVRALSAIQATGEATEGSFARGVAWMISAAVQAPDFLFVAGSSRDDGLESLASRLAYFLWNRPPDETLLTAARDGTLARPEVLRRQAERMLADARSRSAVERFVVGWLDLRRLPQVAKSERYLRFDMAARAAMRDETIRFADAIMRGGEGNLHTLMTARWSYLSEPLFPIYGMAIPPSFDRDVPVSLLDGERYGILTHGSVMAVHSVFDDSSPTARGSMILDNLVCEPIALPDIDIPELPDPVPGQTNRERFAQHTSNAACAGCHSIIDPIGFALEAYDAVGAYREVYEANGQPVDNVGGLSIGDPDADGEAVGARALSDRLLASEAFARCFVTQWMRLGLGRALTSSDQCVRDRLLEAFEESNYDVRALIVDFVTSEAFVAAPEDADA